jgi:hypothetical protein
MKAQWITAPLWIAILLMACCAPKPDGPITAAFDGVYKGDGYSVSPPDWDCPAVQPGDTLTVSGGYATFSDLRGWVAPGGAAALSSQIAGLQGQFQGGHFAGLLQFHERGSDRLTCGYNLKLDRAG